MPSLVDVPVLATCLLNVVNGAFCYAAPLDAAKVYFSKLAMNTAPVLVICKGCGIASINIALLLLSSFAGGSKPTQSNMLAGVLCWGLMLAFMGYINFVDTSMMDATSMDKTPANGWMAVMSLITLAFVAGKPKAELCSKQPGAGALGVTLFKVGAGLGLLNWLMMFVFTSTAVGTYFHAPPPELAYTTVMFKFMGMAQLQQAITTFSFVHGGGMPSKANLLAFGAGWIFFGLDIIYLVFVEKTLLATANVDTAGPKAWILINLCLGITAVKTALEAKAAKGKKK